MRKRHTDATKLAAVFLAQQSSVDGAAEAFRIDPRTISKWVQTVTLPPDKWGAILAVLQARGAEMAARGEIRGLVQTLTAAGIADRNVRYATLIARREARRTEEEAPPESNPAREAIDRLDWRRKRLMADMLDAEMQDRAYGPEETHIPPARPTDVEGIEVLNAWVDQLLALSDDELAAAEAKVAAGLKAAEPEAYQPPPSPAEPPSEPIDALELVPTPLHRSPRAPEPVPMLVDLGYEHDGPWYDLETGERRRSYRDG